MMMTDLAQWIDSGVGILALIVSILMLVGAHVAAIVAASRWVGSVNGWMRSMDQSMRALSKEVSTLRKHKHDHANFIGSAGWRLDLVEGQSERNTDLLSDIRVQMRDMDGLPARLREIDDRLGRIESRLDRDGGGS